MALNENRTLVLLRHAKSSWSDPGLDDFDRPLAPRGVKAADLVGREIARRGWLPDRALVSPPRRTRETWALASAHWHPAPPADFMDRLCEASADVILAAIRATHSTVGGLLVIAHNPGLETLAAALSGPSSDREALDAMTGKFPTAAMARLVFPGEWADLDERGATLTHFIRPADIDL